MAYESEAEQLESIKKWWRENGRVIVTGVVLGLAVVFGWSSWQTYKTRQAESASRIYEEMVNWAAAENFNRVDELAETLMREFPKSGYAPMGALIRAHSAVSQGRPDEAEGFLRWVKESAGRDYLKAVANLRLARLLTDRDDFEGATRLLDGMQPDTLVGAYEELRGDIQFYQGRADAALEHYRSALEAERVSATGQRRLEMKIADLGLTSATSAEQ